MTADAQAHWLPFDTYLTAIERESRRFRECLAGADPALPVPSCPGWSADDLLWHLGGDVQHFWSWIVTNRPEPPHNYPEPHRPDGHAATLLFFDRAHEDLMFRLRNAEPAEVAWSWAADPRLHTVAFTLRRQAHEALIHRVDAELTIGERTPIDPDLAADGVLECLEVMYAGLPPWGSFTPDGTRITVEMTDVGRRLLLGLGVFTGRNPRTGLVEDSDDVQLIDRAHEKEGDADLAIWGTAEQLDLWLWHRGEAHGVQIAGDEPVRERLGRLLDQPIK